MLIEHQTTNSGYACIVSQGFVKKLSVGMPLRFRLRARWDTPRHRVKAFSVATPQNTSSTIVSDSGAP